MVDICFRAQKMMEMCMIKVFVRDFYIYKLIANLIPYIRSLCITAQASFAFHKLYSLEMTFDEKAFVSISDEILASKGPPP